MESDRGWGGGTDTWDIVDGQKSYSEWRNGLAFTGGHVPGGGGWEEPCGPRQATISFDGPKTFDRFVVWHHRDQDVPATPQLEYWDGSAWTKFSAERKYGATRTPSPGSISDEYAFAPVTGSKVKYSFDNCGANISGAPITHGWIYEFEVFEPVDTQPPQTAIDAGPSGPTGDRSPTFSFSASEPGSRLECRLDAGEWGECSSPKRYSDLEDGEHNFEVRASDPAGNTDPTPASRSFRVDTQAPQTAIDVCPEPPTDRRSRTFCFSSSEPDSTFECRLDTGEWEACSSPKRYNDLEDGEHSFDARATDPAGNTDPTPASRSFTVEHVGFEWEVPTDTTLAVSACSQRAPGRLFAWDFGDGTPPAPASADACAARHIYEREGSYDVALTVIDADGSVGGSSRRLPVQDWVIVSIGDSYASGEGNPPWTDKQCHRSEQAGPARAAKMLDEKDTRTSVTFIGLACSGASIDKEGLLAPFRGFDHRAGGLLPPQLTQVRDQLAARSLTPADIDGLLIGAGGNDAGFGQVVTTCVVYRHCWKRLGDFGCGPDAASGCRSLRIDELDGHSRRLAECVSRNCSTAASLGLTPSRVHLTEYPNPTRDQDGRTCESAMDITKDVEDALLSGRPILRSALDLLLAGMGFDLLIDRGELYWTEARVLEPLNDAGARAAGWAGWRYAGGSARDSRTHGYCSSSRWIITDRDALRISERGASAAARARPSSLRVEAAKRRLRMPKSMRRALNQARKELNRTVRRTNAELKRAERRPRAEYRRVKKRVGRELTRVKNQIARELARFGKRIREEVERIAYRHLRRAAGAMHPNRSGHENIATHVLASLERDLYPAGVPRAPGRAP